jgi:AcrR family transcriptional regulator
MSPSRQAAVSPQRRLKPAERERLILDEATRYFSERGLNGGTEELAQRLGVTQPLLFRYFPTKTAMIERIFRDIEVRMFDPEWARQIEDETVPLEDRLVGFYRSYFDRVLTRENFRLFLYGGLAWSGPSSTRHHSRMRRTIYPAIARALHKTFSQGGSRRRIGNLEMEMVQSLHGMMHHLAVRKWVFGPPIRGKVEDLIRLKVAIFLRGAQAVSTAS